MTNFVTRQSRDGEGGNANPIGLQALCSMNGHAFCFPMKSMTDATPLWWYLALMAGALVAMVVSIPTLG